MALPSFSANIGAVEDMRFTTTVGVLIEREQVMPSTLTSICMSLVATAALAVVACGSGAGNVQCQEDSNCDLSGGGRCVTAPTGNQWCAYPDPNCPTGYRYSDDGVGDDVGGVCIEGTTVTLTVSINGPGTVSSVPVGIDCPSGMCTASFLSGTQVHLTATATSESFLGWSGACNGLSDCTIVLDQNQTVGAFFGTPGQALWVKQFGSAGYDSGSALATDSHDDIIAVGNFSDTINFGGTSLVSAGNNDIYVTKLSSSTGDVIWAKRFGGTGLDGGLSVALDAADNVYVTGEFVGDVDFGGGVVHNAGAEDAVVFKLSSDGNFVWARGIGGSGFDVGTAIATRGGAVVVAGYYAGAMTVNGMPFTSAGSSDVFVASLSTDGAYNWVKSFGGTSDEAPAGVVIDSSANVVVAGKFQFTVNFGGGALVSAGNTDVFLLKLRGDTGGHLFSKRFGSTDMDSAAAVAVDSTDNILLAGQFRGSVDFGGGPLTSTNSSTSDVFLAKYSLGGACVWAKPFGGAGTDRRASSLTVNQTGDVAIAGSFNGTISFGGAPLSSASGSGGDVFAARLSGADGSQVNAVRAGGAGNELGNGVAQTSNGRYFVTGAFEGFGDFGGQPLTAVGGDDAFVFGLAPL